MSAIREVMALHDRIAELESPWEDVDHWDVVDTIFFLGQSNCAAHATVAVALREALDVHGLVPDDLMMEDCPHFQDGNCQGQSMCIEDCKMRVEASR